MESKARWIGLSTGCRDHHDSLHHNRWPYLVALLAMLPGQTVADDRSTPLSNIQPQRQERPLVEGFSGPSASSIDAIRERAERHRKVFRQTEIVRNQRLREEIQRPSGPSPSTAAAGGDEPPEVDLVQQAGRTLLAAKHSFSHQSVSEAQLEGEKEARRLIKQMRSARRTTLSPLSASSEPIHAINNDPVNTVQTQQLMAVGAAMRERHQELSWWQRAGAWLWGSRSEKNTPVLEEVFHDSVVRRQRFLGERMEALGRLDGVERYQAIGRLEAQLSQPTRSRTDEASPIPTLRLMTDHRRVRIIAD